jgi:hypothetical protein
MGLLAATNDAYMHVPQHHHINLGDESNQRACNKAHFKGEKQKPERKKKNEKPLKQKTKTKTKTRKTKLGIQLENVCL